MLRWPWCDLDNCGMLQLLALMGVRKLMDFFFTQTELYWLDHMLPGEELAKKDDEAVSRYSCQFSYCFTPHRGANDTVNSML